MNKSFSKLRHIQKANALLEERNIINKFVILEEDPATGGGTPPIVGGPAPTVKDVVMKIQDILNKKFGGNIKVDGVWGPGTQAAFEAAVKLIKSKTPPTGGGTAQPAAQQPAQPAAQQPAQPAAQQPAQPAAQTPRDQRRERQDLRRSNRRAMQDLRAQQNQGQ